MRCAPRPATAVGRSAAPMISGAITACTRSTSRASNSEPSSDAAALEQAPSARRAGRARAAAPRGRRDRPCAGSTSTSAPAPRMRSRHSSGDSLGRRDQRGRRSLQHGRLIRRAAAGVDDDPQRLVRALGGSARARGQLRVVDHHGARARRQSRRAWGAARCAHSSVCGPDTHRESPEAAAMRPSSDAAYFAITNGMPVRRCLR